MIKVKLKKTIVFVFAVITISCFAQKQIGVSIINPINGETISKDNEFLLRVRILNTGRQTITSSDSFRLKLIVRGVNEDTPKTTSFVYPGNLLDSGMVFTVSGFVTFRSPAIYGTKWLYLAVYFKDDSLTMFEDSVSINYSFPLSSNEYDNPVKHQHVYPNPVDKILIVDIGYSDSIVEIFDNTGQFIESKKMENGRAELDASSYQDGIYFYKIISSNKTASKLGKFIVDH